MSRPATLHFLVPAGLDGRTGGYIYDRRVVEGLRALGWTVLVHALDASFPAPTRAALIDAGEVLEDIADHALVVVDGLAFGAMPALARRHGRRLRLVALVHHPLALETGLSAEQADRCHADEAAALRETDSVIVTSPNTARELCRYDVPPEHIHVVLPGTDAAELAPGSRQDPGEGSGGGRGMDPGSAALQMLCVATLTPRKGHAILLEALANLQDRPWELICVGSAERDPATAEALYRQVQTLGLAARVHFAGEVDAAEVADFYAGADLFVLASHYEGYGMVFDEAIARGLPIVATLGGAIAETVPADAGVLVPPGDADALSQALADLMDDPDPLQRLRAGARRARHTQRRWSQAAAEFVQALDSA